MIDFKAKLAAQKAAKESSNKLAVGASSAPDTGQNANDVPLADGVAGLNVGRVLVDEFEDLQLLQSTIQGMAMYQHGIFARANTIIQRMQARMMGASVVAKHVLQKQEDAERIAGMASTTCGNCGLTVQYEQKLDQYPDLCPRCGVPHEGDGKYSRDPELAKQDALDAEDNSELEEKFTNDINPEDLLKDGGLPD